MRLTKIVLLVFIYLAINSISNAQIKKGTFITGGSLSLDYGNTSYSISEDKFKVFKIDIVPVLGYFLLNNLSIELDPEYSFSQTKTPFVYQDIDYLKDKYQTFGLSPKITYYLGKKSFLPYFQFGSSFIKMVGTQESFNAQLITNHSSENTLALRPAVGFLYRLNDFIGLDMNIVYNLLNIHYKNDMFNTEYDFKRRGIQVYFGFKIFLGSK